MNKRVSLGAALAALLMVAAVTFSMTWIYARNTFNQRVTDLTEREQMFEKFAEINKHVRNNFYGSINNTLLMDNVARGYMEGIDDKYSTYITAEEYKKRTQSEEEYVGIGAVIEQAPDDFYLVVTEVYPDSPAQVAGIEAGDLIVKIDDTDLTRENSRQMLESIVGPQGSRITMVTRRGSEERPLVEMTRRAITIPTVEAHMMEQASPDEPLVGYIRIMEFGERTYDQFNRELQRLMDAGAQSLIFDVRDNSGGVMRSATRILDKLLPDGVLLSALHKDGTVEVQATSDANAINLPMTVLVNGGSESAAELFAQVIRDYEKGHIVGAVTAGKGVMQSTIRLSDGSAIELTVALYQTIWAPSSTRWASSPILRCSSRATGRPWTILPTRSASGPRRSRSASRAPPKWRITAGSPPTRRKVNHPRTGKRPSLPSPSRPPKAALRKARWRRMNPPVRKAPPARMRPKERKGIPPRILPKRNKAFRFLWNPGATGRNGISLAPHIFGAGRISILYDASPVHPGSRFDPTAAYGAQSGR